ncbi:MAG: glycerophosphodiester phosphodiesterase family protein [Pirellulaceae bacterium]
MLSRLNQGRLFSCGFLLGSMWLSSAATWAAEKPAAAAAKVTQIVAHRGAATTHPENTLAAFGEAIRVGATATECDVRTSKDGKLFLLHDATLDRTSNGKGIATQLPLADLKQLDAGTWFNPRYRQQRIPSLAEALSLCRGKIDVLLDLKEQGQGYAKQVADEVRRFGDPRKTIVGVRSVEQARLFRRLLPEARQLGLIPNPESIDSFAKAGVEMIRLWPRWLDDKTLVPRVRKAHVKLHLNGTTGESDEVQKLLPYGPDSISADDPDQLIRTLKKIAAGG